MVPATIQRKHLCDGTRKLPNLAGPIVLVSVVVLVLERRYREVTWSRESGRPSDSRAQRSSPLHQQSFEDEDDDEYEDDQGCEASQFRPSI
jgi:hypothetical protein